MKLVKHNCRIRWGFVYLFGTLLVLGSCEEVIESPFEIIESKLVLASAFAPHAPVLVRITATQPSSGELIRSEVTNAEVVLLDGSTVVAEMEFMPGQNIGEGYYSTGEYHPQVGRHYTIHASADGFTPISADSRIPPRVDILTMYIEDLTQESLMSYDVYDYTLHLDYDDPASQGDLYDIRVSQEVIPYRVENSGDTTWSRPLLRAVYQPADNPGEPGAIGGQASILQMDKHTQNGLVMQLQSVIDPRREVLGNVIAELRTVSEPYYLFQLDHRQDGDTGGGIREPQVNVYTNINSGYGVFAGYNTTQRSYQLFVR